MAPLRVRCALQDTLLVQRRASYVHSVAQTISRLTMVPQLAQYVHPRWFPTEALAIRQTQVVEVTVGAGAAAVPGRV